MSGDGGSGSGKGDVRHDIKVDAVYDIETEGWSRFLVGGLYDGETYREGDWTQERDFARSVATSGDVWAHNGGRFDHKWLIECLRASSASLSITCAGSRITEVRGRGLCAHDSAALYPLSLRAFTKGAAVVKLKQPLPCRTPELCGPWCPGYCRFSRRMEPREWNQVREYLRADCESLWQAIHRLKEWAELNDVDLAPTIGGSSWRNVRRLVGVGDSAISLANHRYLRQAYFGGRVQVFRPEAGRYISADVNSLYPAVLSCTPLPVGMPLRRDGTAALAEYLRGRPGMFRARVSVPDMWVPPLPVRTKERVAYPTGDFTGVWAGNELRYAEEVGCKILDVTECMVWPEERSLFWHWVQKFWNLRRNAEGGKSSPMGKFCKLYLNSLVGKLGMKPGGFAYSLNPNLEKSNKWQLLSEGVYRVRRPAQRRLRSGDWVAGSPCARIEWAITVLAAARITWHRQAMRCGRSLIYGDTDNVKASCEIETLAHVGTALGEWLPEGTFRSFTCIAPKFYREEVDDQVGMEPSGDLSSTWDGTYRYRSKGVRASRPEDWRALYSGDGASFSWNASTGFRSASRSGSLFTEAPIERKISRGYGDRFLDSDGTTRPPTIKELAA